MSGQPNNHHGILKQPSAKEEDEGKTRKAFRWDEETIAQQDLERGTRMKIDEPKTPYMGPAADPVPLDGDDFALERLPPPTQQQNILSEAIQKAIQADEEGRSVFSSEAQHKSFAERRKEHYKMFKR